MKRAVPLHRCGDKSTGQRQCRGRRIDLTATERPGCYSCPIVSSPVGTSSERAANWIGWISKRPAGATHLPVVSTQRTRRSLRSPHTLELHRSDEALASIDGPVLVFAAGRAHGTPVLASHRYNRFKPFLRTDPSFRHNRYNSHRPCHSQRRINRYNRNTRRNPLRNNLFRRYSDQRSCSDYNDWHDCDV